MSGDLSEESVPASVMFFKIKRIFLLLSSKKVL